MLFSIDQFINRLNAKFETSEITYTELDYRGIIPVFFVRSSGIEDLSVNWAKLVEAIAFDFQSQLKDEYQIWNIYIFFVKPAVIADAVEYNSLKLKIENDTFSSRKILVEEQDEQDIISEHILNGNMNYSPERVADSSAGFEADPMLWSLLEDKTLKKQKMTSEAGNVFKELVEKLKRPSHEI